MSEIAYNSNSELSAMKEDLASRKLRVKIIGMAISAAFAIGAAALLFTGVGSAILASGGQAVLGAVMGGASVVTNMITMKEVKKLELDEKYLQSYMSGKNYWGEGYREEVAERGFSVSAPMIAGAPPPPARERGK